MVESQIVKLNLTHNILSARIPEIRFDLDQTVASIKVIFFLYQKCSN